MKDKLIIIAIGYALAMCVTITAKNFFENKKFVFQSPIRVTFHRPVTVIDYNKILSPVSMPSVTDAIAPRNDFQTKVVSTPTPTPKKRSFIPQVEAEEIEILHTDIYDKVSMLESGRGTNLSGKHGKCVAQGKTNSIGYAPHLGYCFDSKTDEMIALGKWFQKRFDEGLTLDQALCYWNTGHKLSECAYSINFYSL